MTSTASVTSAVVASAASEKGLTANSNRDHEDVAVIIKIYCQILAERGESELF